MIKYFSNGMPERQQRLIFQAKTLLVMRLTVLLILISTLAVNANGFSQKINISERKASLENVLNTIGHQSGYGFLWKKQVMKDLPKVNVSIHNADITEALEESLKGLPLTFEIHGKVVYIKNKPILPPAIPSKASLIPVIQQVIIHGRVMDSTGSAIRGASVMVKGTKIGTVTNGNGEFSLEVLDPASKTLVISFVGFETQEIRLGQESNLQIKLLEKTSSLNDLVIVGYGTQKKINLSGAVATVSGNDLAKSPAPTFTNLLAGKVAGLSVTQPTGEPGRDAGSLQIRGLGSYGSSSAPLVLVDGIVSSISNLSPQDIESVSVLKDAASASIYGSRGANGVILITTKKGKAGTASIQYINNFGSTNATVLPKFITNSATYMTMFNAARERSGQPDLYSQDEIQKYKDNPNSPDYPNTDWLKYYFHSAPIQSHTLSLSGGTEKSNYYVSAGYQKQKGIIDGYDYQRYNSIISYNTKVNDWVKIGTNINMSYQDIVAPNFTNDQLILLIYAQAPTFSTYLPDGSKRRANRDYADNGVVNRTAEEVYDEGAQYTKNYNINGQGFIDVDILKGLTWEGKAAFVFYNQDYKDRSFPTADPSYAFHPDANGNYNITSYGNPVFDGLRQSSARNLTLTVNSTLNYDRYFGSEHHFHALLGYEQISNKSTNLGGNRYGFTSNAINELDGGPSTGWQNSGNASEYALRSIFSRINYEYKGKYILEGDLRYDGTSRVDPKYRWGTFGGGSAAWRISEEKFIKDNVSWMDDLKLRASYGVLGNQEITNYPYQAVLTNTAYPYDGVNLSSGEIVTALTQANLHWETTTTTDIGLDMKVFKGLFGLSFDWYNKNTTGILAQQSDLPASVGLSAPVINAGAMVNKGIEIAVTHSNHIGKFNYDANFQIAFNRNKVTKYLGGNPGVDEPGLPYNSFYIYQWDGIFQSQDDINNSPTQPNAVKPGDLKMKDITGNGKIEPDDRVSINPYPDYTYSFGLNMGYAGFDLSVFFQGVQGQKFFVNGWGIDPFYQGTAPTTDFLNAWTPENHSNTVPAVYQKGYSGVDGLPSTYFLKDASYLRLKDVNLSYTFLQSQLKVKWLKTLTIYLSGSNLLTWTKYPGADPERVVSPGSSVNYAQFPQLRIFSGGLKISL